MSPPRPWQAMLIVVSMIAVSTGCTRSLEMTYSPSLYRLAQADQLRGIVLGVGKFEDRRSWVDRTEPQSLGYVMQAGAWRFGLSH